MWRIVCLVLGLSVVLGQEAANLSLQVTSSPEPQLQTEPQPPPPPGDCTSHPLEECPDQPNLRCKRVGDDGVLCCHLSSMFELKENVAGMNMTVIKSIHVRNATFPKLDASFFNFSRSLESLSITDGHITLVNGRFPASLTCLNLSANMLVDIEDTALSPLSKLNYMDISGNNLTRLPAITVVAVENFWLDISGTNALPCHMIQDLMSKMGNDSCQLHFLHKNQTFCNLMVAYWFNATVKVALTQVEQKNKVLQDCPRGHNYKCTCRIHRVDIVMGSDAIFSVAVDCSGQQLTELPAKLPLETVALNVSNNNISNLFPLVGNEETGYSKLREFDADNNRISSISILEGSEFITKFSSLSLKHNDLLVIPTYFLSSRFDRNDVMIGNVYLGGNKIECNCATFPLKAWLIANRLHVRDYYQVQCKNMELNVVDLERSQVCVYKHVWTDFIYYIIAGEVALLVMLVLKVFYDYWVFKTAGYLPWPASKMPKLPCDWLCET